MAGEGLGRDLAEKKARLRLGRSSPGREAGIFDWLLPVYLHLSEQLECTRKSRRKLERREILAEETSLFFSPLTSSCHAMKHGARMGTVSIFSPVSFADFQWVFSAGCLECLGYTETDHIRNDTHAGLTNFNDTILGTIQLLEKNKDLKTHYLKIALSISLFHI